MTPYSNSYPESIIFIYLLDDTGKILPLLLIRPENQPTLDSPDNLWILEQLIEMSGIE
jgi:hypothetical protein